MQTTEINKDAPEEFVRLGSAHGYTIDADRVTINAELSVSTKRPSGEWRLELWAAPSAPQQQNPGLKVAEVPLARLGASGTTERVQTSAPATLPPHGRDYAMTLTLVRRDQDGERIVDASSYQQLERFPGPHLAGGAGYELHPDGTVSLYGALANARGLGNQSGSLRLELWALPTGYDGGQLDALRGHLLANAELGTLLGGHHWSSPCFRVAFSEPPRGSWRMALVLREWTPQGFQTRDFFNFDAPYQKAALAEPAQGSATPAVDPSASLVNSRSLGSDASATKAAGQASTKAKSLPAAEAPAQPAEKLSIRTASVEELSQLDGLTPKLAREIVRSRPYESFEELLKVKGIGDKMLRKLRGLLKL